MTHEEIKEKLIKEVQEVFNRYDLSNTYDAVKKIIDEWYGNKLPLISLFSKHKNWNPNKFFIHFDTTISRDVDMEAVKEFFFWVGSQTLITKSLAALRNYEKTSIDSAMQKIIAEDYPQLKINSGLKTSRATNKILTYLGINQFSDYEKRYAKYSNAVNPLEIVRHTIISLNPVDYLLASNGNSWSSCHTIDVNNPNGYSGCHRSGTLSYMMDSSSIVVYQVDKEYDGNDLELQPKIIRQMFHYKDGVLIQGRLYPQCNDGKNSQYVPIRAIMQSLIAECLDLPNLWQKKGGTSICEQYISSIGNHYYDYIYQQECNVSRIVELIPTGEDTRCVPIGHESYCIVCGESYDISGALHCSDVCENGEEWDYVCTDCGSRLNEEDVIWVDGQPYCSDCVLWCECCKEYHRIDDVDYYPELDEYICDSCRSSDYSQCCCCQGLVHDADTIVSVYDDIYCESCAEGSLTGIDGEYYPNDEVKTCPICGQPFVGESEYCSVCEEGAEYEQ